MEKTTHPYGHVRKDTLQLDGAVDYKSEIPMGKQLDEIAPDGVDFFFDNVGGQTLVLRPNYLRYGSMTLTQMSNLW